jgi:ComF family protein
VNGHCVLQTTLADFGVSLLDLVFPRVCAGCGGETGADGGHLCWDCRSAFRVVDGAMCDRCGDPVDGIPGVRYRCSWCQCEEPSFDLARSAVRYRGPARDAIHLMKYGAGLHVVGVWIPWLVACSRTHYAGLHFDGVTFVPMSARRERERSYNQARLLAAGLARALDLPLETGVLARGRDTCTQTRLTMKERRENVRGAFLATCPERVRHRRFLLVDDVITTGATVNACSAALKEGGAASVHVVSVARG